MRTYEPAWLELKKKGKVRLAVPRALHARVLKAVIKEKDMDVGYKLEMLESKIKMRITHKRENSVLTLTLTRSYTFLESVCASEI